MELKQLGNTDIYTTPLTYGAWEIGGAPFFFDLPEKEAVKVIRHSYEAGINAFDTAPVYGFGRSEKIVGKAVKGFRDKIIITTKCGLRWKEEKLNSIYKNGSRQSILHEIDLSLERLKSDYIDVYLVHWPDNDTMAPLGETIETLETIQRAGKIRYYGLSNFNLDQIKEAQQYGAISCLQSQYSMLFHEVKEKELPYCGNNGIGFQAYSPLARGLLTDKSPDLLKKSRQRAIQYFIKKTDESKHSKVEKIKEISAKYEIPLASFAIAWTISQPHITTALTGSVNPAHIEEAIKGLQISISDEDCNEINSIILE